MRENRPEIGRLRRGAGLVTLAGVHAYLLAWSCLTALFVPRYRRLIRFQVRYLADVLRDAARPADPSDGHSP